MGADRARPRPCRPPLSLALSAPAVWLPVRLAPRHRAAAALLAGQDMCVHRPADEGIGLHAARPRSGLPGYIGTGRSSPAMVAIGRKSRLAASASCRNPKCA